MKQLSIILLTLLLSHAAHASLSCQSRQGKKVENFQIELDKKGNPIVSDALCFGGEDLSVEKTKNFLIINCGDDGRRVTTLESIEGKTNQKDSACKHDENGKIDWGSTTGLQGSQYTNMANNYPYEDGLVSYLVCCFN